MRDYDHASKLFVANGYALVPKHTFLFHVFFDTTVGTGAEEGMLVKQCTLPKLTFDTKTMNQYNRPWIIQTKVHYDPVTITMHDDSSDVIRRFLFNYYKYYFADVEGVDYGYRGRDQPYLKSIRIYSLFNKKFSEYILVNPVIKNMSHPEHHVGQGGDVMQHTMTVEYETVLLSGGSSSANTVNGFAELHYDKSSSPIPHTPGNSPSPYSSSFPKALPGVPVDPYGGSYNQNFKPPSILTSVAGALGAAKGIIGTVGAAMSGDVVGSILNGASAIGSVERLMGGGPSSLMPKVSSQSMNQNILSSGNPNSPVSIPTVGGALAVGNQVMSAASNIGTKINNLNGVQAAGASAGLPRIPGQVTTLSNSGYGSNTSTYVGASTMAAPMPADLAAKVQPAIDESIRQVNSLPAFNLTGGNSDAGYIPPDP